MLPSAARQRITENSAKNCDEAFQHQRLAAQRNPIGVVVGHDPPLALAVIAIAAGLEDRGRADGCQCALEIVRRIDRLPRRGPAAQILDKALFADPVLRHFERARPRAAASSPIAASGATGTFSNS